MSLAKVENPFMHGGWLRSVSVWLGRKACKVISRCSGYTEQDAEAIGTSKCIDKLGSAGSWDVLLWCGPEVELTVV